MALLAQAPFDPYRPDFAVVSYFEKDCDTLPWLLLVEADGHNFHERTKEQAARDRSRDRFFASRGAVVLRFTGSEIYADADGCACEVVEVAMNLQSKNLGRQFRKHLRRAAKRLRSA